MAPVEGHVGGYLFYFSYLVNNENLLLVVLLPFATAFCVFNVFIKRHKQDLLLLVWILAVFGLFTVAQTKIYWYILPVFPAFALAISNLIYEIYRKCRETLKLRSNLESLNKRM